MHRPAQRDQRNQRDQHARDEYRPSRRTSRLRRVLVCAAAVPAVLVAAGCSSDSGSPTGSSTTQQSPSARPSQSASASADSIRPAVYTTLPKPCTVLSKKTLGDLVPEAKSGKQGSSDDPEARVGCSWDSLKDNGVKGSQFRWLNVSLLRFESDAARGEADKQARQYYDKQVHEAASVDGAGSTESEPLTGTGDQATTVRYDLKKKEGTFKQQTVVARVENVVVTLDYNGAGLAGDGAPDADALTKAAEKAVKEVVAAVSAANKGGDAGASTSTSPSAPGSKGASPSASKSASESASPSKSSSAESSSSKPADAKN
ncbi:DUF3558 family protein [Streptomyces nodosus]